MSLPLLEPEKAESERDPRRQVSAFVRRMARAWPSALIVVGLAASGVGAFMYYRPPAYHSETVLLYSQGVGVGEPTATSDNSRNAGVRLKELLLSRPRLGEIVARFGLYPNIGQKYGAEDAILELKRHVEFRAPGGDTFTIGYQGATAAEARAVTEALAQTVIVGDADLRRRQAELSLDFLSTERASKTRELKDAEQRLATFMGAHRRFALDATPLAAGAAIRATTAAPGAAAGPVGAARAPVVGGVAPPRAAAAVPARDSEDSARALAGLAAARANLAEQLRRYTPAHPDVRAAQGELDRATARLASVGSAERPAPPPEIAAVEAAPAPPPSRRSAATSSGSRPAVAPLQQEDVVLLETEWSKLTREVTGARQRLDQVEAELFKADVVAAAERAGRAVQISIIDPAFLPQRPLGPAPDAMMAALLALSALLGLLVAGVGALLDDRVYLGTDVALLGPVLAEVPKMKWRRRS